MWLDRFLALHQTADITSGHEQLNTAAEIVDSFRQRATEALREWSHSATASEHISALLSHLQLCPVECESAEAAVMHAAFQASDTGPADTREQRFASRKSDFFKVATVLPDMISACI